MTPRSSEDPRNPADEKCDCTMGAAVEEGGDGKQAETAVSAASATTAAAAAAAAARSTAPAFSGFREGKIHVNDCMRFSGMKSCA